MQTSRWPRCLSVPGATLLAIVCASLCGASDHNVTLFVTDDESPTLGCYGDPVAVTPHVDALASDGVLFRNAYAKKKSHHGQLQSQPQRDSVRNPQPSQRNVRPAAQFSSLPVIPRHRSTGSSQCTGQQRLSPGAPAVVTERIRRQDAAAERRPPAPPAAVTGRNRRQDAQDATATVSGRHLANFGIFYKVSADLTRSCCCISTARKS